MEPYDTVKSEIKLILDYFKTSEIQSVFFKNPLIIKVGKISLSEIPKNGRKTPLPLKLDFKTVLFWQSQLFSLSNKGEAENQNRVSTI
jgi:hypothetical protein